MLTAPDGIAAAAQLRWNLASTMGALHPRMLGLPPGQRPAGRPRVYQYHVRKSAGTSVVFAFFALAGEAPREVEARLTRAHFTTSGPYTFVEHDKRLIGRGHYTFASSHLPAWDIHVPPGTFTVTVLRDPVRRVLSLYRYLREPGSDDGYAFPSPPSQRQWAADGFDAFMDRVPAFHLLNQVYMFSRAGSVDEAAERIGGLSLVLHTESFAEDLAGLGRHLGLPLVARSERKAPAAEPLSAGQEARLREALEPEYRLLACLGGTAPPAG